MQIIYPLIILPVISLNEITDKRSINNSENVFVNSPKSKAISGNALITSDLSMISNPCVSATTVKKLMIRTIKRIMSNFV